MKKKLLFLLTLGLGAAQVQAQTQIQTRIRPALPASAEMPAALRQALAKHGLVSASATGRSSSTARKPGKTTNYTWDPLTNNWSAVAQVAAYTYDAQARLTQTVQRDSATQQLYFRFSTSYDAAGNPTGGLEEIWDGAAWQNQTRWTGSYNSAGLMTESVTQSWVSGAWQNFFRSTASYDARNHYTQYTEEQWRGNAWSISYGSRSAQEYSPTGALLQETEHSLDVATNTYEPSTRRLYTYATPTATVPSSRINQQWDNGAYVNQTRAQFTYDAQNREIATESELWVNGAWELSYRFSTVYLPYDSMQNLFEVRVGNVWENSDRYTYSYDAFGNSLGYVSEKWSNNAWTVGEQSYRNLLRYSAANDLLAQVQQHYNPGTKAYENASKQTYGDFQSITLGVQPNALLAAQTQLYPNPTTGAATLELSGLANQAIPAEVINSLGQVVQRLTLQPRQGQLRQVLELGQLPGGIYMVRLHTGAGVVVKKLVKQ